jgi:hypothetical protein
MSAPCKFYVEVADSRRSASPIRLKCTYGAGHSSDHHVGVRWPLEEKPKLRVPDLRPMDFFSLFGERYQVEATSGTTVWARLTVSSAGFDEAIKATFDLRWLAKHGNDFERLAVKRFPRTAMVPVELVESEEAA